MMEWPKKIQAPKPHNCSGVPCEACDKKIRNQALSDCLLVHQSVVKELEAALKAEKFMVIATKTTLNESIEQATRYKKALAEIENNHFECDAGEACKAHSIAKKTLKEDV